MKIGLSLITGILFIINSVFVFAQETDFSLEAQAPVAGETQEAAVPMGEPAAKEEPKEQLAVVDDLSASDNVTLDFKDADIRNVLKIISFKSGANIVATPEVMGNITIRLVDVPWEKALDVILKTYGFGYEKQGSIVTVAPIDKLTALKKQEIELAQVQPTITEVFTLKYIEAQDAKKALDPQLSPRGKITILEMTGQAGWEFGADQTGKRRRTEQEKIARSKVLIVSDIPPVLDKITEVIKKIDVKPAQIFIQARIFEVNRDRLKDFGFDWGTGTNGATTSAITDNTLSTGQTTLGGHGLGSLVKPSGFNPKAGSAFSGVNPYNVGLELVFKKISSPQFEIVLHALEEDVGTNTLSAPRILALNNQEATILVNTRYPILKSEITTTGGTTPLETQTLDYYQDIGIQLNVVPQVGANNSINMVIHPAVTSYTDTLSDNAYPIIQNREAETRILMQSGETVVIGGLIKDVQIKSIEGVPFLKDIPYLGRLFRRDTVDTEKVELLVFLTATIITDNNYSVEEIQKIKDAASFQEQDMGDRYKKPEAKSAVDKKKKKN